MLHSTKTNNLNYIILLCPAFRYIFPNIFCQKTRFNIPFMDSNRVAKRLFLEEFTVPLLNKYDIT